jgi:hypothetical protein
MLTRCLLILPLLAFQALSAGAVDILPDVNLTGWTRIPIPPVSGLSPKMQWRVDPSQRVLICSGDGGHEWLRYDKELGDFALKLEWRFTPKEGNPRYNSGIGVRMSKQGEIWHQAQTGASGGYLFGDTLIDGAIQRMNLSKTMKENRVKPAGEWNLYEIRAQGDGITLSVNGAVVSEFSGCALRKGYIGLEAEGFDITFRNIRLQPLD